MSVTLATILVGLGYDLSGLEKGSPEAFRLINQQTLEHVVRDEAQRARRRRGLPLGSAGNVGPAAKESAEQTA